MQRDIIYWEALKEVNGIGPKKFKKLIDHFGNPEKVFEASERDILQVEGVNKSDAKKITDYWKNKFNKEASNLLQRLSESDKMEIKVVTLNDIQLNMAKGLHEK